MPEEYNQAKAKWQVAKSESAAALSTLKQLHAQLYNNEIALEEFVKMQSTLYEEYIEVNQKQKKLHKIALDARSEAKFLGFDSFQYFLGELGWAVGLFLYAFANLLNTFYLKNRYLKREFTGKFLLHSTLLFVGCFYTFYVFYSRQDFAKIWYVLAMILCTVTLFFAAKFIIDTYTRRTEYLRENINKLIAFIFRIRNKHYRKLAVKALHAEKKDVVIDRFETVEDNYKEFDNDFYKTIHKIRT